MNETAKTLGSRLRQARIQKGLNQEQVAAIIGKTTTAYGHYERDRNEMSKDVAQKLAINLGISLEWLLTGSGSMIAETDEFLAIMAKIDDPYIRAEIKELALKRLVEKK